MNKAVTVDQDIPKTSLIGSGSLERVMRAKMEVYNRELKKRLDEDEERFIILFKKVYMYAGLDRKALIALNRKDDLSLVARMTSGGVIKELIKLISVVSFSTFPGSVLILKSFSVAHHNGGFCPVIFFGGIMVFTILSILVVRKYSYKNICDQIKYFYLYRKLSWHYGKNYFPYDEYKIKYLE